MFLFSDPVGRNFLSNESAATAYRQRIQGVYEEFARRINSGFTWLEAFQSLNGGQLPQEVSVEWSAFPITSLATDEEIDRERLINQDEYVEWRAESKQGQLVQVTFTTEFPEYFEAFASISFEALVSAIQDVIPAAQPTSEELFGPGFNPAASTPVGRAKTFRNRLRLNPWNNGKKGILCLMQQFNTLGALFNLVATCGVLRAQGTPQNTCSLVGNACGDGRSSDPAVCAESQRAVRNDLGFTIRDPAGVRLVALNGIWKNGNDDFDINNPTQNNGSWVISRNGRRGVLTIIDRLTLDGQPVITGSQISRKVKVAADLLAVPNSQLPVWARIGVESTSRGLE